MNERMKKQPSFNLGKEIAKKEQKKVLGGATAACSRKCKNSLMNCTTSPITTGYCQFVWPASGGVIENCSGGCS